MTGSHGYHNALMRASALAIRLSHPFRGESVRATAVGSDDTQAVLGQEQGHRSPVAVVVRVVPLRHERHVLLVVACPYCARQHTHGSGGPRARLSHCRTGAKPYRLGEVAS